MASTPQNVRLRSEHGWLLVTTGLAAFVATAMATAINVTLPTLSEVFGTSFALIQWVVLAYLMATIALVPLIGRLADMLGKRHIFLAGHVLYIVGSLLCAVAPDALSLILFRVLQGAGSAAMTSLGLSILSDHIPAAARGRALGINGALISAGVVIGPSLGGFVTDVVSWRWIFLGSALIALLGALLVQRVVPRDATTQRGGFDLAGGATLFAALMALSLALTLGQGLGFGNPRILALFAISALLTLLFVAIERRVRAPVVDLRIFRNRDLSIGLVGGLTTFVTISGVIFLMPFYLSQVRGLPAAQIGLLMAIVPLVLVVIAPIAGTLADRFGPRPVTVVGMLLILIGYLAVGTLDEHTTPLGYVLRFLPVGLGMGAFQAPNNSSIMGAARRGTSGVTGGLLALTRFIGQVIGTAVLGSLWVSFTLAAASEQGLSVGGLVSLALLPAEVQVAGLQRVMRVVQGLIALGLLLVLADWIRSGSKPAEATHPPVATSPKVG